MPKEYAQHGNARRFSAHRRPEDDLPILSRRIDGVEYLDTSRPEWQEMKPILDVMNEALKAAGKSNELAPCRV